MKKALAVLIILSFLGTASTTPAFATVKAGAKCSDKGQVKTLQGKKFTCIKNGKKLVWNKGILIAKTGSQSSPMVPASPTPKPVNEVAEIVLDLRYPKVDAPCEYDKLRAYRYSLIPGYSKSKELRWLTCNRDNLYELGLDIAVDLISLTPVVPKASIYSSDPKSYDSVSAASQAFVDNLQIGSQSGSGRLILFIEPAEYGDYLDLIKSDLDPVLAYYDAIGISSYMPKSIKIFIGKTNSGISSMIAANCRREGLSIPGGTYASICDDGQSGMVVFNASANLLGGMIYDQQADLSKVTKSREMILAFRWALIHELYHQFQLGAWQKVNLGPGSPLPWIVEGSAQAIPFYYLAKSLGTANSYQYLWEVIQLVNLVPPGQGPESGPTGCTNPAKMMAWNTEDARRQCQYTQGHLIVETFVARYGMNKWVQLVVGLNPSNINQFEQYFKSVSGDDLAVFYEAADEHSRKMGFQIK
jgi:hypothetical protein